MEFGRIEPAALKKAKLALPPDHPQSTKVLASNKKKAKPKIHVGCAKWGRPDWVGKIYPKKTKAANFLAEYAKQFNCIELNAISYKLPDDAQMKAWMEQVGKDFVFVPKFSETITHRKRLKNCEALTDEFLACVDKFGKHLGPMFLMPHPQVGPKQFDTLKAYIESLPDDLDLYVELRHPEWFKDGNADELFKLLQKKKIGSIITDTAGRRDCVHMRLSTPDAFIRFVGNSLDKSDYKRIDDWVERLGEWIEQGLRECWFFMHMHDELYSPELIKYLIEKLNKKYKLNIHVPVFYN